MEKDIEKQNGHLLVRLAAGETYPSHIEQGSPSPTFDRVVDPADPGEAQVATIRQSNGVLRWLRHAETWLDRKLNFEAMGVERMPESKRRPPEILNVSDLGCDPCWESLHDAVVSTCIPCNVLTLYCRCYSSGSPYYSVLSLFRSACSAQSLAFLSILRSA